MQLDPSTAGPRFGCSFGWSRILEHICMSSARTRSSGLVLSWARGAFLLEGSLVSVPNPSMGWDNSPCNNSCHFMSFVALFPAPLSLQYLLREVVLWRPPSWGWAEAPAPTSRSSPLSLSLATARKAHEGRSWSTGSSLCLCHPAAGAAAARRWGALPVWCDGEHSRTSRTRAELCWTHSVMQLCQDAAPQQHWEQPGHRAGKWRVREGAERFFWGGETRGDGSDRAGLAAAASTGLRATFLPASQPSSFGRRWSGKLLQPCHGQAGSWCGSARSGAACEGQAAIPPSDSLRLSGPRHGGRAALLRFPNARLTPNSSEFFTSGPGTLPPRCPVMPVVAPTQNPALR